ncbi:MAG: type II secretion system protein GspG [Verrucomicrobiota bacterium]
MKTIWMMTVLLTPYVYGFCPPAAQVESELKSLESALSLFKMNAGKPPPADSGLQALVERPRSFGPEVRWMQTMDKLPEDPWGKSYCYLVGDGFPEGYGIYSRGPDRTSNTQGNDADDLNSWRPGGPERRSHELLWILGVSGAGPGLVFLGFRWGISATKRMRAKEPVT